MGAGSAGCVLANRLSENPHCQVLLIEAGGRGSNPLLKIPGAYIKLFRTRNDWQFWTTPQEHVLGRKLYLPRGKTLGGCSATNAMAYVRGNKADYDHWAELGNAGWDYESIKKYFLKSEGNEQAERLDEGYHSTEGPLNVTLAREFTSPFGDAFLEAGKSLGIPENRDYNGEQQEGIGRFQFTIKKGQRHSAFDAFVSPIRDRSNLTIVTGTLVRRVILEGKTATGVEVYQDGKSTTVHASGEVVLSAGAFQSPQLLQLSGIGDPDDLTPFNIPVKHELLGVGKNLQDHLFYPISCTAKSKSGLNHSASKLGQIKGIIQYSLGKKGPFTASPLEAYAFFNVDDFTCRTNCQFHFSPMHPGAGYDRDLYDIRSFIHRKDGFTILPSLLNPKSRGAVSLHSSDPTSPPKINPNFLSAPQDLELLGKGGKIALDMIETDAMQRHVDDFIMPAKRPENDEELKQHILKSVETIYHPVGTCKMGNDDMAVVDAELKVHGLENLRVIDGSIMPTIVSGNTNAPIYMIAEKGADMILNS